MSKARTPQRSSPRSIATGAEFAAGKIRYGLMLHEDEIAMDSGTPAPLAEAHFVLPPNALKIYQRKEFARQCLFPSIDAQLISTTEA
jgi:hypothetical protein